MRSTSTAREASSWTGARKLEHVEGVHNGLRRRDQQRALPEVIDNQTKADEREPVDLDRFFTEVTEVRVERFASRRDEEDGAQHEKSRPAVAREERDRVSRIDGRKARREPRDREDSEQGDRGEPEEHDRTEDPPDCRSSPPLEKEETDQN